MINYTTQFLRIFCYHLKVHTFEQNIMILNKISWLWGSFANFVFSSNHHLLRIGFLLKFWRNVHGICRKLIVLAFYALMAVAIFFRQLLWKLFLKKKEQRKFQFLFFFPFFSRVFFLESSGAASFHEILTPNSVIIPSNLWVSWCFWDSKFLTDVSCNKVQTFKCSIFFVPVPVK